MRQIFGIVSFTEPLYCAADSLGKAISVSLQGIEGSLTLPSLPPWDESEKNSWHKPLLGPLPARSWKRGDELIFWGHPISYPQGEASVKLALFEFLVEPGNIDATAQLIYSNFDDCLQLFEQHIKLITKQGTKNNILNPNRTKNIDLVFYDNCKLASIVSSNQEEPVVIIDQSADESLHFNQFEYASQLASKSVAPHLHYQMLLEAYSARRRSDYRKAIIEATTALEIGLTMRIEEELKSLGVSFGKKLLQKFKMLGGRLEIAKLLEIPLPDKDYSSLILNPRNDVIHRAASPDQGLADSVIAHVEEILYVISPQIHDDRNLT